MTEAEQQTASADELIETGLGLIARGMFRRGDKSGENNPREAYESGMSVVSVVRGMALDFLKLSNSKE